MIHTREATVSRQRCGKRSPETEARWARIDWAGGDRPAPLSYPRQNVLTRALQEYGRLIKTLFILRYLENVDYRRRINAQLNKGESLHALRDFLFVADKGVIRRKQEEAQTNQAMCLNLITNAVVVWNTVYMQAVLDSLRAEGSSVEEDDVAHLSPARFEHVNPYGKY